MVVEVNEHDDGRWSLLWISSREMACMHSGRRYRFLRFRTSPLFPGQRNPTATETVISAAERGGTITLAILHPALGRVLFLGIQMLTSTN